jgi:hypothetical protein
MNTTVNIVIIGHIYEKKCGFCQKSAFFLGPPKMRRNLFTLVRQGEQQLYFSPLLLLLGEGRIFPARRLTRLSRNLQSIQA